MTIRDIFCKSLWFQLLLVSGISMFVYAENAEDWMPDPALRQAVREQLELPADEPLTKEKMLLLTRLDANHKGITDITGLEYGTNLKVLHLGGDSNHIADLRPLANLTNLVSLHIWHTGGYDGPVTNLDLRPLANLINLT